MADYLFQIYNLLPLFGYILAGYLIGKIFKIKDYSLLPQILLYIFWPILAFNAIATAPVRGEFLVLPFLFIATTTFIALAMKKFSSKITKWDKSLVNTFAYSSGSANVVYFGVPALIALLGEEYLPIIFISVVGYIIYDNSIGYLIISNSKLNAKEIFIKLIKFPPILGILAGFIALALPIAFEDNNFYSFIVDWSRKIMSAIGLLLIGLAVAQIDVKVNYLYMGMISTVKVILNPLIILIILLIDKYLFGLLQDFALVLLLIASVPVASNAVILAAQYSKQEQTAAVGVLATAILSLISIPLWQVIGDLIF